MIFDVVLDLILILMMMWNGLCVFLILSNCDCNVKGSFGSIKSTTFIASDFIVINGGFGRIVWFISVIDVV